MQSPHFVNIQVFREMLQFLQTIWIIGIIFFNMLGTGINNFKVVFFMIKPYI